MPDKPNTERPQRIGLPERIQAALRIANSYSISSQLDEEEEEPQPGTVRHADNIAAELSEALLWFAETPTTVLQSDEDVLDALQPWIDRVRTSQISFQQYRRESVAIIARHRLAAAMAPQDGLREALEAVMFKASSYYMSVSDEVASPRGINAALKFIIDTAQKALAASPAAQHEAPIELNELLRVASVISQRKAMAPAGVQSDAKTPEQHAKEWIESHINPDGTTCFDADLMKFQSSLATWFMSAMREAELRGIKAGYPQETINKLYTIRGALLAQIDTVKGEISRNYWSNILENLDSILEGK